ncbi:MAG: hypothetical protein ACOC06_00115 [Halorubrum sp.]
MNGHDPKPLYHRSDAEVGPEFYSEYRERDPGEFGVLFGKTESSVDGPTATGVRTHRSDETVSEADGSGARPRIASPTTRRSLP